MHATDRARFRTVAQVRLQWRERNSHIDEFLLAPRAHEPPTCVAMWRRIDDPGAGDVEGTELHHTFLFLFMQLFLLSNVPCLYCTFFAESELVLMSPRRNTTMLRLHDAGRKQRGNSPGSSPSPADEDDRWSRLARCRSLDRVENSV